MLESSNSENTKFGSFKFFAFQYSPIMKYIWFCEVGLPSYRIFQKIGKTALSLLD